MSLPKIIDRQSTHSKAAQITGFAYIEALLQKYPKFALDKDRQLALKIILNTIGLTCFDIEQKSTSTPTEEQKRHTANFTNFFDVVLNDTRKDFALTNGKDENYITTSQVATMVLARVLALSIIDTNTPSTSAAAPQTYPNLDKLVNTLLNIQEGNYVDLEKLRNNLRIISLETENTVKQRVCAAGTSNAYIHSLLGIDPECNVIQNEREYAKGLLYSLLEQRLGLYLSNLENNIKDASELLRRRNELWRNWGDIDNPEYSKMLAWGFDSETKGKIKEDLLRIMSPEVVVGYIDQAALAAIAVPFSHQKQKFADLCAVKYPELFQKITRITELLQSNPEYSKQYAARLDEISSLMARYIAKTERSRLFDLDHVFLNLIMLEIQNIDDALSKRKGETDLTDEQIFLPIPETLEAFLKPQHFQEYNIFAFIRATLDLQQNPGEIVANLTPRLLDITQNSQLLTVEMREILQRVTVGQLERVKDTFISNIDMPAEDISMIMLYALIAPRESWHPGQPLISFEALLQLALDFFANHEQETPASLSFKANFPPEIPSIVS